MTKEKEQALLKVFEDGIKGKGGGLLGLEIEHFVVDKATQKTVSYYDEIEQILCDISCFFDEKIYQPSKFSCLQGKICDHRKDLNLRPLGRNIAEGDGTQGLPWGFNTLYSGDFLIALRRQHLLVSLEPAGQLEVSIGEFLELEKFNYEYEKFINEIAPVLDKRGLELKNLGYHPVSKASDMPLLPKERYKLMDEYFKTSGETGLYMMRGSAAVHVAVDYFSEKDAVNKYRLSNLLAPLFIFLTDNAQVFEGEENYRKMLRHWIWAAVDCDRCGIVPNITSFKDYANYVLSRPIIIKDENNSPFHELSMVFPYVRLKNFIEIRTADSMPIEYALSYLALIKGIFYNEHAINVLLDKFQSVDEDSIIDAFDQLIEYGYDAKVYGYKIGDLFKELFALAEKTLSKTEKENLQLLKNLVKQQKILAEIL